MRPKPFHVFKPFVGSAKKIDEDTDRCPIWFKKVKCNEFSDSKDFCLFWQALRWSALPWPWDVLLDPENGICLWLYREILHHCIMAFRWKTSMKLCLSFNVNRTNKYLISWPLLISLRTVDISWQKLEVELNLGNLLPRQSHGRTYILSQRWGFVGHASAKVCAKPGTFFFLAEAECHAGNAAVNPPSKSTF